MRWHTNYLLADDKVRRHAWEIARGKRSLGHRLLWDYRRGQYRKTGIVYLAVYHDQVDQPLWLVVSRPGPGPQALVPADQRTHHHRRRRLAGGIRLCPTLAGGAVLPSLQDRSGHGKSQALVLGEPPQAPAHGQPALFLPPLLAEPPLPASAPRLVTQLVP